MGSGGSHGWRVPPPSRSELIDWPADFGRRFVVFVDTEEEFDWAAGFSRDSRSVEAVAALPIMHRRFADRGVAPCYLCDYPVVADPTAADILRQLISDGVSAIGAQLHPWVNPPHDEQPSELLSFAGNLPAELEAAKLDRLTAAISKAVGVPPRAFRAGRYGLGPHTLGLLATRGYRIDTSMRALHDYAADGGPDFSAIGNDAFRVSAGGDVIEVPLTTVYTGALRQQGRVLHRIAGKVPRGRGVLARTGLLSRVPLTPEGVDIGEAVAAVRVAVKQNLKLLTFSFHSPSLVPGNTPYVRDDADLARFHNWWSLMLDELERLDVRPIALADLIVSSERARQR